LSAPRETGPARVFCDVCGRGGDTVLELACRANSVDGRCIANFRACCASSVNAGHARSCPRAGRRGLAVHREGPVVRKLRLVPPPFTDEGAS